jgi:hypothetical protein
MNLVDKRWKTLFFFCLGLAISAAFCMKWLETEFQLGADRFTMIGLELTYSREKVLSILGGIDAHTRAVVGYQLYFDFVFMAGVYPGIAALCMLVRSRLVSSWARSLLSVLAFVQTLAWATDIRENLYLLHWLKTPVIGNEFTFYHVVVIAKWSIALFGCVGALVAWLTWSKRKE